MSPLQYGINRLGPAKLPFLFDKRVIPVELIVLVGDTSLALLFSCVLVELIGVLVQPVMRFIWSTPGPLSHRRSGLFRG